MLKFISYFRGPILYVMELAVILAAGLRDWIDFGVIVRPLRRCPPLLSSSLRNRSASCSSTPGLAGTRKSVYLGDLS